MKLSARLLFSWLLIAVMLMTISTPVLAAEMRVAVTTSFHNSGLSDILLPRIKEELDVDVRLIVVGTGQALKLARAGDVDAILVHSKKAEEDFVKEGYGTHRREIMYNDFVIVGPSTDPANVTVSTSVKDAFLAISASQSVFVSRGDDSGTHRRELALWKSTGLDVNSFPSEWYRALGSGMGATLNTASGMNAYIMTDRASWLKFGNKGDLQLLFSGDPALFNQYAYLPVNPAKHTHVNYNLALKLETWLTDEKTQSLIGSYKIADETLFTPNAKPN